MSTRKQIQKLVTKPNKNPKHLKLRKRNVSKRQIPGKNLTKSKGNLVKKANKHKNKKLTQNNKSPKVRVKFQNKKKGSKIDNLTYWEALFNNTKQVYRAYYTLMTNYNPLFQYYSPITLKKTN